jgi:hypothetical protein
MLNICEAQDKKNVQGHMRVLIEIFYYDCQFQRFIPAKA